MGAKKIFNEKCILMAKSKGNFLLLMKTPIPGVAEWMLFTLGSSSVDASDPGHFLCLGLLCVGGGGGWHKASVLACLPLKRGGGIWLIHFGATEKDLGYFGLWDSIPTQARKCG